MMILEGVVGIVEGLNPKLIRSKLEAYAREDGGGGQSKQAAKPKAESNVPATAEG